MSISSMRDRLIDYAPCRYNGSRLWFRGPRKSLRDPYIACLGGCEVYGRYVRDPLPELLGKRVLPDVVNLGVENAGVDAYLNDPGALVTASQAQIAVIQLTGSHNTSNRFYSVHPRRNDRFLKASDSLRALYPEMDFTEVHFTRHLLGRLHGLCQERYNQIATEVRRAYRARLQQLISQMNGKTILLWFAPTRLGDHHVVADAQDPFLTRATVRTLKPVVSEVLEVVPDRWSEVFHDPGCTDLDVARMARLPGPEAHEAASQLLAEVLKKWL